MRKYQSSSDSAQGIFVTVMILSFWTDMPWQTVQTQIRLLLIRVYTVCHSVGIVWAHYYMVEPHSSNFRVITTIFLGVRIFRKFTVCHVWNKVHTNVIWALSSEFVSSSIPSWQILTAHAQPFKGARDLAFCLKVPLDSLLVWASSGGSGETARMRRLAWTFAARRGDKYQIRLTRSKYKKDLVHTKTYKMMSAKQCWIRLGSLIKVIAGCSEYPKTQGFLHADNENSDQTAQMRRLIWVRCGQIPFGRFCSPAGTQCTLCFLMVWCNLALLFWASRFCNVPGLFFILCAFIRCMQSV